MFDENKVLIQKLLDKAENLNLLEAALYLQAANALIESDKEINRLEGLSDQVWGLVKQGRLDFRSLADRNLFLNSCFPKRESHEELGLFKLPNDHMIGVHGTTIWYYGEPVPGDE